jgi:hypothetical protein
METFRIISNILFIISLFTIGCGEVSQKPKPRKTEIVKEPEKLDPAISKQMSILLDLAVQRRYPGIPINNAGSSIYSQMTWS